MDLIEQAIKEQKVVVQQIAPRQVSDVVPRAPLCMSCRQRPSTKTKLDGRGYEQRICDVCDAQKNVSNLSTKKKKPESLFTTPCPVLAKG